MNYFDIFCRSYTWQLFMDVWYDWHEEGYKEDQEEPQYADLAPETIELSRNDCRAFLDKAFDLIIDDKPQLKAEMGSFDQAGYDFYHERRGSGVGFWDGDWPVHGDELSVLCKKFKSVEPYVGDDGKIYVI